MNIKDQNNSSRSVLRELAPYAAQATQSRGRLYPEPESAYRSPFQRDRDRIIHCSAFRRLTYKTQVFVYHEGDHYRRRLTHSLEVAQIARTISRVLGLDEDLAEALALAHDLGHPPFGHAGERALNTAMREYGGFDHNAQSLRIVTELECKYAQFDGLNLSWETLEGLVKHNGPLLDQTGQPTGSYKTKILPQTFTDYNKQHDLALASFASAEAQVAAIADDIAYNNHDIDDALRAGLIELKALDEMPITARLIAEINKAYPALEQNRIIYELNRRLITHMVNDAVEEAGRRLAELQPQSLSDIQNADRVMVTFSEQMQEELEHLRFFLMSWVYRSPHVSKVNEDAVQVVGDLFERYMSQVEILPDEWKAKALKSNEQTRARLICDFVAGMTDRFAIEEHQRLFDQTPELR